MRCNAVIVAILIGLDALAEGNEARSYHRSMQYDEETRVPLILTGSQPTYHPNTLRPPLRTNIVQQHFSQIIEVTQPVEFDPKEIDNYERIVMKYLLDSAGHDALVCRWVMARILKCFKVRLTD